MNMIFIVSLFYDNDILSGQGQDQVDDEIHRRL